MSELYQIQISHEALNSLKQFDNRAARRIRDRIEWLAANPDMLWHDSFVDRSHWQGLCKTSVGDYRVIYMPDQQKQRVIILIIDQRRNIYYAP